ncbi:dephospho-CoA kinase [Halomonas sp. ZH2S]|uniref:Dephospho-CoA kinase n=1 Tax=Vreelandella zhuhanensis TaxID=2684210 RepID=A0A7X3KPU7_9GAMM|nr:dephospho-CoA kinase [Halomonas zhuhanensis]MWJ26671.1 dephospho-CoA kinase [Halomonas zhuhanensis]
MIIGLTGGIASGKSTVVRAFESLGVPWVDADDVAREVVQPGEPALEAIAERFGTSVLQENGSLDRRKLRDIIFNDPEQRLWLESVTHPRVRERLLEHLARLQASQPAYVMLVSPLLFESGQDALVDRCVVVDVPEALQLQRTQARDDVSESQVRAILAVQLSRQERLSRADDVIDNSRSEAEMREQVAQLDRRYRELSQP